MARNRTLHKAHPSQPTTCALSHSARLIDLGMTTLADDEGLLAWDAAGLRVALFPRDEIATLDRVAAWMREIEDAGIVHVYTSTRAPHPIAFIIAFRRGPLAQRPDRPGPASLPPPNWRDPAVALIYARRDGFLCAACGEPLNEEHEIDADPARYNPVCERIKQTTPGIDDPTNIRTVHAMCARTPTTGGRPDLAPPIPGVFGDRSTSTRRALDESSTPQTARTPRAAQVSPATSPATPAPEPHQIRRALDEHSTKTAEDTEPLEPPTALDGGLFPLTQPPAPKTGRNTTRAKDPQTAARAALAKEIADAWWTKLETKPAAKHAYIAKKKIFEQLLDAGHTPEAIAAAADACGYALTLDAMQFQLRKAETRPAHSGVVDLDTRRPGYTPSTTDRKRESLYADRDRLKAQLGGGL